MKKTDTELIQSVAGHVKAIMQDFGMDLADDSIRNTPLRVAKMLVTETFSGLRNPAPKMTTFKNKFKYNQLLVEHNIIVHSTCEHHWQPIIGFCHIGYMPEKVVLGLSKFHRIVHHYARRPQIQERLGEQIARHLTQVLRTDNIAVLIQAEHFCCRVRGVRDNESYTTTTYLGGAFRDNQALRSEFYNMVSLKSEK